ncbi:MAG: hypothetical protein WAU33_20140 [Candidatus Binataceae bacterium]
MKKTLTTFAAMVFVGAMGTAATAQVPYNGGYGQGVGAKQVNRFQNGYLDEHPEVASELGHNPALVDNTQFMANHPGLRDYFESHPGVRADIRSHPDRFMSDEWKHDAWHQPGYGQGSGHGPGPIPGPGYGQGYGRGYGPGIGTPQVNRFDNGYLDEHPEVAHELGQNPGLVDNPQFMAQHPGLQQYFANHPEVRADLKAHPDRFMSDEWRHDAWHHPGYANVGTHPMIPGTHPIAHAGWQTHPMEHYNQRH